MRLRLLAGAAAATLLASTLLATSAAATHSGNYHWARTANPFTLKLDDNMTAAWDAYLNTSAQDWSASSVLDTVVMQGLFGSKVDCAAITGHVELCNTTYGNTGWLSILSISITTGNHLSKASIKFNDTYWTLAQYNLPPLRQMVMCEQIGHALGLAHQNSDPSNPNLGSCMDHTNNPSGPPSNEHPNLHDFEQLAVIYAHLDGFTTPTSGSRVTDRHPEWGTLVDGSAGRGVATYVRDLGDGQLVMTRVVWA